MTPHATLWLTYQRQKPLSFKFQNKIPWTNVDLSTLDVLFSGAPDGAISVFPAAEKINACMQQRTRDSQLQFLSPGWTKFRRLIQSQTITITGLECLIDQLTGCSRIIQLIAGVFSKTWANLNSSVTVSYVWRVIFSVRIRIHRQVNWKQRVCCGKFPFRNLGWPRFQLRSQPVHNHTRQPHSARFHDEIKTSQ